MHGLSKPDPRRDQTVEARDNVTHGLFVNPSVLLEECAMAIADDLECRSFEECLDLWANANGKLRPGSLVINLL